MKNKYLLFLLLVVLGCLPTMGQRPLISDLFKSAPSHFFPYLSNNEKLDMLDFAALNMTTEVTNELDGKSSILMLTDSYLKMKLSRASLVEMRLLPVGEKCDSMLLCVVTTLGDSVPQESKVEFFNCSWQPLSIDVGYTPLSQHSMVAHLSSDDTHLTCRSVSLLPRDSDETTEVEEEKVLKWTGEDYK